MTKKITLLSLLFCSALGFAQQFEVLKSQSQTKIIYDQVIGLSDVAAHPKSTINASYFKQVYYELQRADSENRFADFALLKDETTRGSITKQLPLSVLVTQFESLSPEAIAREDVYKNSQDQWVAKPNTTVFTTHNLALASALNPTISGLTNTFLLKNNLIFNTTNKTISAILANFNDGQGWRTVTANQTITVTFPNQATQKIDFRILQVVHILARKKMPHCGPPTNAMNLGGRGSCRAEWTMRVAWRLWLGGSLALPSMNSRRCGTVSSRSGA